MSTQPTEAELQAQREQAAKDQAAKDKAPKDQAAKAPEPWTPKKGGDCHVMVLKGGPRLERRPAKVLAVRQNGAIDAEVIMSTGEIVKREGIMPASSSRLGDGYTE